MNMFKKIFFLCGETIKKKLFYLFVILLSLTILELASLGLVIPLLKLLIEENQNIFFFEYLYNLKFINSDNIISYIFLAVMIVFLIKYFIYTYFIIIKSKLITDIRTFLSLNFFTNYLNKDLFFFLRKNTSELLRNCDQEIVTLGRCINAILVLILEFLIMISVVSFIIYVQPLISLVPFIIILLFSIIYYFVSKNYLKKIGAKRFELQATKVQFLIQGFGSIREIKINQNIKFYLMSFQNTMQRLMKIIKKRMILNEVIRPTYEILIIICLTSNTILLKYFGFSWNEILSIIVVYGVAAVRVLPGFNKINQNLQALVFNSPAISKLFDEMKSIKNYADKIPNDEIIQFKRSISLKNIIFGYQNKDILFNDLNLEILKGDIIGITGKSGSGKSSLLELIAGLVSEKKGSILIDNISKNLANNVSWYSKISYSSEKSYLIDDTLLTNITLSDDVSKIDHEHLNKILKMTNILSEKNKYEINLDQKLGEVGKNLSTGQKQRISLARALYKKSEILILDETTNAVDELTQDKIIDEIFSYANVNNITVIVVSHDQKVLYKCKKNFLLKDQKITNL